VEAADLPERTEDLLNDGAERIAEDTGNMPRGIARGLPNVGEGVGDAADGTGDAVEASDVPEGTGDPWEDGVDWIGSRAADGFADALEDLLIDLFRSRWMWAGSSLFGSPLRSMFFSVVP